MAANGRVCAHAKRRRRKGESPSRWWSSSILISKQVFPLCSGSLFFGEFSRVCRKGTSASSPLSRKRGGGRRERNTWKSFLFGRMKSHRKNTLSLSFLSLSLFSPSLSLAHLQPHPPKTKKNSFSLSLSLSLSHPSLSLSNKTKIPSLSRSLSLKNEISPRRSPSRPSERAAPGSRASTPTSRSAACRSARSRPAALLRRAPCSSALRWQRRRCRPRWGRNPALKR